MTTMYQAIRPRRCDDSHALAAAQCIVNGKGSWVVVCRSDTTILMLRSILAEVRHIDSVGDIREINSNRMCRMPQIVFVPKALMQRQQIDLPSTASLAVCWPVGTKTLDSYVRLIGRPQSVFASTQGND